MDKLPKLEISKEDKKKLAKMKTKLDKFKKEVISKFDKYVIGIALFPPSNIDKLKKEKKLSDAEIDDLKKQINVYVLMDDSDSKKMNPLELRDKLFNVVEDIARKTDKNIKVDIMLLSELRESCFDGKYEVLEAIGKSAIVYDKGMLGALKAAEIHKKMALDKFEKYILSYVAAGSLFRGDSKPNDIDVFVVVDDTDVKRMSRAELKDKLRAIIQGMGIQAGQLAGVKATFHVQTYILTDFWDSIKDANPVIFTLLRDGVPLFDRGTFMPWKLLLKMGRIKPSPEAIDMNLDIGQRLIQRAKAKLLSVVGEDLYWGALNPAQAALMLYGIPPPTPKETIKLLDDIFVKKEKLLEKKYVDTLEKIRKFYKQVEHGKIKEISGKEVDVLLKEVDEYLKRIRKLFEQIGKKAEVENVLNTYDMVIAVTRDALLINNVENINVNQIDKLFKKNLVDKGIIPEKFLRILNLVIKTKKDFENKKKKISKQEVEKANREARIYIKAVVELIQRKQGMSLEKSKIRFKHGKKIGEVLFIQDRAFIMEDVSDKNSLKMAKINNGRLEDAKKSSLKEMDKLLNKVKVPSTISLKGNLFNDLKKIIGKDIDILIN